MAPKTAHLYIKGDYLEIETDWTDFSILHFLKVLEKRYAFTAHWDIAKETYTIPLRHMKEFEDGIRGRVTIFLHNAVAVPAEPVVLRVEYIGACKKRTQQQAYRGLGTQGVCYACSGAGYRTVMNPTRFCNVCGGSGYIGPREPLSYATAWVNDGWNAIFSEKVLREFFPVVEKFDGDFYKALLKGSDLSKEYKKLARQFHPDLNRRRDAHDMFVKLKEAYGALSDPQRRKRYEAGLKFQVDQQAVDVGFRIPRDCGDVTVECESDDYPEVTRVKVKKILSWNDVIDEKGRVMCSSFNPAWRPKTGLGAYDGNLPFMITWEYPGDFEIDL